MEDVRRTFTSYAMTSYIDDESFCSSHITWSGAFASRIRDSLAHNDIMSFIATEEESENNCAKLWQTVVSNLNSSDLTMARTMAHWNLLFGLKCEEKDDFLQFYSKSKSILHKLKRDTSVAVTDDVFLRAYFSKVIEAPELQDEVKKLIKDKTGSYESILELIHQDYRAQETGEALRDHTNSSTVSSRRASKPPPEPEQKSSPSIPRRFPSNEGNLLVPHYYSQFRAWYTHMSVPRHKRTEEDTKWIQSFVFEFKSPRTLAKESSFHPGSNKNGDGHNSGSSSGKSGAYNSGRNDGGGGGGHGVLSNRPQYSNDRYHSHSGNNDTRGRRVVSHSEREYSPPREFTTNDDNYEDFLAWKNSNSRSLRRGCSEDDSNGDRQDPRRRRVGMFNM